MHALLLRLDLKLQAEEQCSLSVLPIPKCALRRTFFRWRHQVVIRIAATVVGDLTGNRAKVRRKLSRQVPRLGYFYI